MSRKTYQKKKILVWICNWLKVRLQKSLIVLFYWVRFVPSIFLLKKECFFDLKARLNLGRPQTSSKEQWGQQIKPPPAHNGLLILNLFQAQVLLKASVTSGRLAPSREVFLKLLPKIFDPVPQNFAIKAGAMTL